MAPAQGGTRRAFTMLSFLVVTDHECADQTSTGDAGVGAHGHQQGK